MLGIEYGKPLLFFSTIHAACLDITQAFQAVNDSNRSTKSGFFSILIINQYSKLNTVVRWQEALYSRFLVRSGVHQGITHSSLFNLIADLLMLNYVVWVMAVQLYMYAILCMHVTLFCCQLPYLLCKAC